ncbi:MAG: PAS domain-containing sensor histidine kinase [Oscillospiraceae bacterium]|nr:PAS domain-containing sensor histidine kinase [Oscillospiraceae bacterium]
MSSKIFKAILIAVTVVFLASLVFILGISYYYFSGVQRKQLRNETELAAQGVSLSGLGYFENLNTDDYRITWIDSNGSVLFDNEADSREMENHLERREVKQALESGYGESSRYSSTLAEKQLYAAKCLPDGSVIRLSINQLTVWVLLLGFAQPICLLILLALVLSFVLASRLAGKIVKPINEIDPNNPDQYIGKENYKEVEPLLRHISDQQRQLKKNQEEIEKTALIRQEFTGNVSHELKTPLHAISGYAELIENGMAREEDIKPFAGKILAESTRMKKLVEDIIELTKLDNSGAEMKWEDCDLYRIAKNAVDSLETCAADLGVTVSLEGETAPMRAIPQTLYSIVYNLCDNAIKYNKLGGSVTIRVRPTETSVVLTVRDTGIGIPLESCERIFERFYRVEKSRSKEVGGTGLGLSIVKHAVMIYDGIIEVNSEIGKGTEFIITLSNKPKQAFTSEENEHD